VVVAILAILSAIGFLALQGYSSDAKEAKAKANVRTVMTTVSTESAATGNSPRYYVAHDPAAALTGAVAYAGGDLVALTGGQHGTSGTNYSA
jgi:type II secretory pathway pseudopilin PulG